MNRILKLGFLPIFTLSVCAYALWWLSQPTQVDAVHRDGSVSYAAVLVTHFPLTDRGRINWWLENKERLKLQYGIPAPDEDGSYKIVFRAWDGIYRIDSGTDEDSDLRCFQDMQEEANCIVKADIPLEVSRRRDGSYSFYVGTRLYSQAKEGDEPKRRFDWEEE